MATTSLIVAALALAIWIYLLAGRGGFWLASRYDDLAPAPALETWPRVNVVVPARDEAPSIGDCIRSILSQPYPGELSVILIDDQSQDGTADIAIEAAASVHASHRLTILPGRALPSGWTGKMWALKQGQSLIESRLLHPHYVLLTDADIIYSGDAVMRLVARAERYRLVMASVMARLNCESWPEKFLIPAFIFFFSMIYPFSWVRDTERATAAAAGGCLLARWDALLNAGGIDSIRGALIDDCALGARLKMQGPVWLGYSQDVRSVRASNTVHDIGRMISRSAYAQLRYSPLILAGTVVAMIVLYIAPVLIALFGDGLDRLFAISAWLLMALAFQPTLRYYRQSPLWGLFLPAIAVAYMVFTINSAIQYKQGRGGMWKGRAQAQASRAQ